MNLSILLVLVLNFLGTQCGFISISRMHCNNWVCRTWNIVVAVPFDPWSEEHQPVPEDSCICVPEYKCDHDDISSKWACNPTRGHYDASNLVCCTSPVRSTNRHATTAKVQTSNPDTECTCIPSVECHDEDIMSNSQNNQENCSDSNEICCYNLVEPISPPTKNPLPQPHDNSTQSPSPRPEIPVITLTNPEYSTQNPSLEPQPTIAPDLYPSAVNCTCTPFFKCYDEETSSNLTNVVDDRISTPVKEESCSDPNDICCHNLVKFTAKPTIDSTFKDCQGSCVSIKECPDLLGKLSEAKEGNADAVQELRSSVCSRTNENLNVCCPTKVKDCSGSCLPIKECPSLTNTFTKAQEGNSYAIQQLRKSVCSNTNGILRVCCGLPPCQFPFIHEGVTYTECTTVDDPDGQLWCSTQTDNRNIHIIDQWKHCTSDDVLEANAA